MMLRPTVHSSGYNGLEHRDIKIKESGTSKKINTLDRTFICTISSPTSQDVISNYLCQVALVCVLTERESVVVVQIAQVGVVFGSPLNFPPAEVVCGLVSKAADVLAFAVA